MIDATQTQSKCSNDSLSRLKNKQTKWFVPYLSHALRCLFPNFWMAFYNSSSSSSIVWIFVEHRTQKPTNKKAVIVQFVFHVGDSILFFIIFRIHSFVKFVFWVSSNGTISFSWFHRHQEGCSISFVQFFVALSWNSFFCIAFGPCVCRTSNRNLWNVGYWNKIL